MNSLSDDALILSMAQADEQCRRDAVTELYYRYAHRFNAYLLRRGTPAHEAEELVQDAFVRLMRHAGAFKPQGHGNAWIWQVARSTWLDVWKKKGPDTQSMNIEDTDELALPHAPDTATMSDYQDCVHGQLARYIRAYPEGGQAVLWAAVDGLSTQQIAELLGRTAGAARQFLSQARKRLKEYLEPCLEG